MTVKYKVTHKEIQTKLLQELTTSVKVLTDILIDDRLSKMSEDEQEEYKKYLTRITTMHRKQIDTCAASRSLNCNFPDAIDYEFVLPKLKEIQDLDAPMKFSRKQPSNTVSGGVDSDPSKTL